MNGALLKPTNIAPQGGLFGSQQRPDHNEVASEKHIANRSNTDTLFGQPTHHIHPPPGYGYPPLQPQFPGAPQFNHHAPFNMTPSSHPRTTATHGYQCYGPSWQAYDLTQGGYAGLQMFPPQHFTGHGPSLPGAQRVPPVPLPIIPVSRLTTFTSTAAGQLPGAPVMPPISLPSICVLRAANGGGLMLQGLRICLQYQIFPIAIAIQIMRVRNHRTWVVPQVKPDSVWCKQNSPWWYLPKEWGSLTLVYSTRGRKYGRLRISRTSIG